MNIDSVSVIFSISNSNRVSNEENGTKTEEICPICWENFDNQYEEELHICEHTIGKVVHAFHRKCIRNWVVRPQSDEGCPLCKNKIEKWKMRFTGLEITFSAPQIRNLGYRFFNRFEVRHPILSSVIFCFLATLTVACAGVWFSLWLMNIACIAIFFSLMTSSIEVLVISFLIGCMLWIGPLVRMTRELISDILEVIAPPIDDEPWIEQE